MNTTHLKKCILALAATLLIAALSACQELSSILSSGVQTDTPAREIPVGIVMPISGKLVEGPNDRISRGMIEAFRLARDEINSLQIGGSKLKFIVKDDQGTEEGALRAFNKLIHDNQVVAILGPTSSTQVSAAFPFAQQSQVVAISPTSAAAGLGAIGDFVFRVNLTVDKFVPLGVGLTHQKLGYGRVAKLVDSSDVYSVSSDKILAESLLANGVEIAGTETFETGDVDYTAQLTRIKELKPDAIFISAQPINVPYILIQCLQVGIPSDVPVIVPLLDTIAIQTAGDAAEGAITFSVWNAMARTPGNQDFVRRYQSKYGMEPTWYAALAYASVHVLANAISGAGSTDSQAIREALANLGEIDTVLGKFSFDDVGDAIYSPAILIVKDGELVDFE